MYRYLMHKNNKTKSNDFKLKFKNKINQIHLKININFLKRRELLLKNVCVIIPARNNSKKTEK